MADPDLVRIPVLGFDANGNAITTTVSVGGVNTGAEIKVLYEGEVDTNAFTDPEKAKLAGIESGATADQTASEIVSAINSELGGTTWQTAGGGGTSGGISAIPLQVPAFADLENPPKYKFVNGLPLQCFEQGDAVKWPVHIPEGFGSSPALEVFVAMETANSGTLHLEASVDAISPRDSQTVSKETYDVANDAVVTVPSTPETLTSVTIPLTSSDNLGAGDIVRLKLKRSTGTASGGMWLLSAALTSAS